MSRKVNTKQQNEQDKESVYSLVEKIKSYWPDLEVNPSNLTKPTSEFVYTFYSKFYFDFESKLSEITEAQLDLERQPHVDSNKYSEEVSLSIKLRDLCKELDVIVFCLSDMCDPLPKRTGIFFTLFMNLLLYMKSNTDSLDEIKETVEKKNHLRHVYSEKQNCLQKLQDMIVYQNILEENLQKISQEKESLMGEYRNVLVQKTKRDIAFRNDNLLINKLKENLKNVNDNNIKLKEELSSMQDQILCETEVDNLKEKKKLLNDDLESLDVDQSALVVSLENQEQKTKAYSKCLEKIKSPIFSTEGVKNLERLMESFLTLSNEMKTLNEDIDNKESMLTKLNGRVSTLKETILKLKTDLEKLKYKTENVEKEMKFKINNLSDIVKQSQILQRTEEREIGEIKEKILLLKEDISHLEIEVLKEYSQLIENEAEINNNFNNALINIDNYLENFDESKNT